MSKDKKDKKDKKEKVEKKEKKEKVDEKKEKKEKKDKVDPQKAEEEKIEKVDDKKDKKEKKDKKDKKEKKQEKAPAASPPSAKKPRVDDGDDAGFWADLGAPGAPVASAPPADDGKTAVPGTPDGAVDEAGRLAAEAETAAAKAAAAAAADRRREHEAAAAREVEAAAAAEAEAELRRKAEQARLAQEVEAARLQFEEDERRRIEEEEAAKDPMAPRSVPLSRLDVQWLHEEGGRHLKRVQALSVGATIDVPEPDEDMGQEVKTEARVSGASPEAIARGDLCLRAALASFNGHDVELSELPVEDAAYLAVFDLPESVGVAVQPQKLAEKFGVIAAVVQHKVIDPDAILPKSRWAPAFARGLGLSLGLAVEGRFDEDWFHGDITGFNGENGVVIRWLGGDGEAELPAVDVRRAQNKPPPLPKKEHLPGGRFVVLGGLRSRMAAMLHAMTMVERKSLGHFSERNPLKESSDLFGFGLKIVKLPAGDGGTAVERRRPQISAASEAIVEVMGRVVIVAGEPEERARAEILITQMVPKAGPFGDAKRIPESIEDSCSLVRVPTNAYPHITGNGRAELVNIEDETSTIVFWLPVGTESPSRANAGGICIGGAIMEPMSKVQAKYESEYFAATILSVGSAAGKVLISWEFDGSEQEVSLKNVKVTSTAARQRSQWLESPRVLAIIGPEKNRRACALKILAASEEACPGLWSSSTTETLAEVRDGAKEDDVIFGVEAVPLKGSAAEVEWATSAPGLAAATSAARAAHCIMEYVGRTAMFVGFPHERELAREYARWAMLSRRHGGLRLGTLSVPDADMREDITVMTVQEAKVGRLRPEKVVAVERDTEIIALFDDGGGTAQVEGNRRLLICGGDAIARELAVFRIQAILDAASLGAFDVVARSVGAGVAARPDAPAPSPAPVVVLPVAAPAPTKTNPKQVLSGMAWPSSINEWGTLQKKVWEGHPKLPPGWIRVWSRSQDSEYYLRLKDMKTSFDFDEVRD